MLKIRYRKTPLLVSGVDLFSNANIYVLNQLIAETKTDLESTTCPLQYFNLTLAYQKF
jgi:hypothetical protein